MAITTTSRLPQVNTFEALRPYLQERDNAPPTALPQPEGFAQTDLGNGWRYDVLSWDYAQAHPPGLGADGFIVYWAPIVTADPRQVGLLVAAGQRSWGMFVPSAQTMSYALAAYRHDHVGEIVTQKVQLPSWRGAGAP